MSPLWGKQFKVEPFFMSVFTEELCQPLDPQKMLWARENAVVKHDQGLLVSGAVIFIALHLGWYNLQELNLARAKIYEQIINDESWDKPGSQLSLIAAELSEFFEIHQSIDLETLRLFESDWAQKLHSRLQGLLNLNTNQMYDSVSIFGDEGFAA